MDIEVAQMRNESLSVDDAFVAGPNGWPPDLFVEDLAEHPSAGKFGACSLKWVADAS